MGGDDGLVGAEAVLDGVAAGDRLARPRSSVSHTISVGSCGRNCNGGVSQAEVRLAV